VISISIRNAAKAIITHDGKMTDEPAKPLAEKDLDMLESAWVDIGKMKDIPLYPRKIHDN